MQRILVIGSSNTDMVVSTSRFPKPGETILGGQFYTFPGGKGANQAVAAARLGGDVTFIYKTGNDIFGKQATDGFLRENINVSYAGVDANTSSGVAVITVDEGGENNIVVAPGANNTLNKEDITGATMAFNETSIVLMQLEIPVETVMHAAQVAAQFNTRTILNPAPAQSLPGELFQYLFAITPNETEAEILTGIEVKDESTASQAAESLLKKGVENVLITLGDKGAYFKNRKESFLIGAEKVNAVDTTAAGDVFNGALAVALAEERLWADAVAFACKAATISVTRMGAQTSAPYRTEVV